jgi:apolipoprotein N-acyltransferase
LQPNVPLNEATLEKWQPWSDPRELQRLVATSLIPPLSFAESCSARTRSEEAREQILSPLPGAGPVPAGTRAIPDSCSTSPLIIWAENPAPFYFTRDRVFHDTMGKMARQAGAYLVFNTVTFVGPANSGPRNSAIVLDPEGRVVGQYDKIHLVPFGEYVPWWAFPSKVGKIAFEAGTFVPGTGYRVAHTQDGTIGVFICYEDIFPQLVRRLTFEGAGVLVNISNDAWYGDSAAAFQHLEMARLRAIENHRFLLRATNDGITVLIDPYGRILERLSRHETQVLAGDFGYLTGRTFYTAYGDVFAWLCVAATAALILAVAAGGYASPRGDLRAPEN